MKWLKIIVPVVALALLAVVAGSLATARESGRHGALPRSRLYDWSSSMRQHQASLVLICRPAFNPPRRAMESRNYESRSARTRTDIAADEEAETEVLRKDATV